MNTPESKAWESFVLVVEKLEVTIKHQIMKQMFKNGHKLSDFRRKYEYQVIMRNSESGLTKI